MVGFGADASASSGVVSGVLERTLRLQGHALECGQMLLPNFLRNGLDERHGQGMWPFDLRPDRRHAWHLGMFRPLRES